MIKVGNQTNSQDPQAVNSRVFVGNLNTFQATKTDVERLFQRYGRIAGISMHKGFAFIQFTNPFDARSACMGEDARSIFGQVLDVNMVAEPKPAQTGRKRQQLQQQKQQQQQQQQQQHQQQQHTVIQTANDWYYAAAAAANPFTAAAAVRLAAASPPSKRQRAVIPPPGAVIGSPSSSSGGQTPPPTPAAAPAAHRTTKPFCLDDLKTYSSPDILICGNCREMFGDAMDMLDHKRSYCKLRFACKCGEHTTTTTTTSRASSSLVCALCKESFNSAWDLMVHFQTAHTVNIYRLGSPSKDADARSETTGSDTSMRDAEVKDVTSPGSAVSNGTSAATATEATNGSPARAASPVLKITAPERVNGSAVAQRS